MIRFMNLGATLALNMSDYERGMKKAADLTAKAEGTIVKLGETSERAQAKMEMALENKLQKEKEVNDAIVAETKKTQDKIDAIKLKASKKNQKDAERLDLIKANINSAVEVERRFAARMKEADRQLSDDRIAEIRRVSDERIASANKERTELLKIAKQSVVELTAVDKTREQALGRQRTGLTGQLTSESLRQVALERAILEGAQNLQKFSTPGGIPPNSANSAAYGALIAQQSARQAEISQSIARQGSLKARIGNIDSKIDTLGIEDGVKNRIFQLDKQISVATDAIVNAHTDKWKEKQKSLIGQLQTNKDIYVEKNKRKIEEINQKLATLGQNAPDSDILVRQIESLEKQKNAYIKRKTAELKRAEDALIKSESEAMVAATRFSAASDNGPNRQAEIDKWYQTYSNRAAATDIIGNNFTFGGLAIGGGLAGMVKAGAEISRDYLRELHSTSITTQRESKAMFDTITAGALQTGKRTDDLAKSYREIENIVDKDSVIPVFNAALKASVATGTDLSEIAVTLAKSISIFGGSAGDATRYVNTLAKAAALSALDMKQLSHIVGQSFGLAKAAGVGFVDTTTALTVFTKAGLDSTQAATQFRNGLQKLLSPSKDVQKELGLLSDKTGVNLSKVFTLASVKSNGLIYTFEQIRKVAKLTGQDFSALAFKLFPNLRGTLFGLTLASEEGFQNFKRLSEGLNKTFRENEDFIGGKYNETIKDASTQIDILARNFDVLALEISKAATPTLLEFTKAATSAVQWFTRLDSASKENIINATKTLAVGSLILGAGFKIASMYYALRASILGVAAAQQLLTAASGEAGVAGAFSRLAPILSAAKNPWVLLGLAVTATAAGAYLYFAEASSRAKKALEDETKAKQEAIDKTIEKSSLDFDNAKKTQELVDKLNELNTNTAKTKGLEEERLDLLTQISKLSPDLITGYNAQHKAIGLVADAYDRLNKSVKESNLQRFQAERERRRLEIVEKEKDPVLAAQKKKVDVLTDLSEGNNLSNLLGGKGFKASDERADVMKTLFGVDTTRSASGLSSFAIEELTKKIKKEIEGLAKLKSEVEFKQRLIIGLRDALGKSEAEWHEQIVNGTKVGGSGDGKLKKPDGPPPVIIDAKMEEYAAQQAERLQRARSAAESLFSKYREAKERLYYLQNGESNRSRGEFTVKFLNDDIAKMFETGITGSPETKIQAWIKRTKDLAAIYPRLMELIDGQIMENDQQDRKKNVKEQLAERIRELLAKLNNKEGEKEKTEIEKLQIWLEEKDLKTGLTNRQSSSAQQIADAINYATKVDKGVIDAKVLKGEQEISSLLNTFLQNKKEGEEIYNGIKEIFEKNPALKKEYGMWVEVIARAAQNVKNSKDNAKEATDYVRELNKRISDLENPLSSLDRAISDITDGKIQKFGDIGKVFKDPNVATAIEDLVSKFAGLRDVAANTDRTFENLEDRVAKLRGKIASLAYVGGSFEEWYSKTFGEAAIPDDKRGTLEEFFRLDTAFEKLEKIKQKLTSLRKKEGVEDAFDFDESGRLKKLDNEMRAIDRYENRLKDFRDNFRSIFQNAFQNVLQKSGNFWKSLGDGAKALLVKGASEQFTNGVFEVLKQGVEKVFPGLKKPEYSKDSMDIIKNPAGFLKSWEDIMFKKNNVMQVSLANSSQSPFGREPAFPSGGLTPNTDPLGSDADTPDKKSRNKSGLPEWMTAKNVATAYAISRSKAGQEVAGFGTLLKGAAGIKGIGTGLAKGLGMAGGLFTTVGVGLAINDLLGNPLGKLKKKIFGRSVKGGMSPGNGYVVGEDGPEFIVPDIVGSVRTMPNETTMPGLIIQGDLNVSTPRDAEAMGREFARVQRISQGISGQLQRRRAVA